MFGQCVESDPDAIGAICGERFGQQLGLEPQPAGPVQIVTATVDPRGAQDHPVGPSQGQTDQRRRVVAPVGAVRAAVNPEALVSVEKLAGLVGSLPDSPVAEPLEPFEQTHLAHGAAGDERVGR